jgi:hypothetical protein
MSLHIAQHIYMSCSSTSCRHWHSWFCTYVLLCAYVTLRTVSTTQIVVIMLAGYETSVTAASTALMLLPQYPEVSLDHYTILIYTLYC